MVRSNGFRGAVLALSVSLAALATAPLLANTTIPILFGAMTDYGAWIALATVIVAVIERPFVSKAGVAKRALLHSLIANVISMVLAPLGLWPADFLPDYRPWDDLRFPLATLLGLLISIGSEFAYYRVITRRSPMKARLSWVALANVVSLAVLLAAYFALLNL